MSFTNKELFTGIIEQNQKVLNYLYKHLFSSVKKAIYNYGGDYDTANEVFQEAIISLYTKAKQGEFEEPIMVENYIMGTCKILWQKHILLESRKDLTFKNNALIDDSNVQILKEYGQSLRMKLYQEHFIELSSLCQKILKAFFKGDSYLEIAEKFEFASEEYARRKKYLCKEYLVKSIKSDPRFDKLIGELDDEPLDFD
ncbi:RNA polymerase sigma factor [Perlabentimonas gracilis]|uniref:RNA polymerase sigma factor n=1 Tax=Perlabentimonas gracilis TaxID=2715279 RepID=UPI001407F716|nr:sigma-70 family RNA polymerase sigma factor [Perlabentimonas gracilis]NHB70169.1 sigma-70 family RNA polymerase sigma factor [Perlabentimonas gracilis]